MPLVDPASLADEVDKQDTPETPVTIDQSKPDENLPEKFRGKSLADVVASYQSLESELGRARNEIGTSRRVLDELLNLRRIGEMEKSKPEAKPVTAYELAENPEETITNVASRVADERARQSEQRLLELESQIRADSFEKKHPGFRDVIQSAKFLEWVGKSPTRVALTQKAAQGDWDSGDELMSLYKEYEAVPARPNADTPDPKKAAKEAALAKSGGSGANKVVNGGDGRKTYKRTELARLYIDRPEEYDRLWESELKQAYAEGRVR